MMHLLPLLLAQLSSGGSTTLNTEPLLCMDEGAYCSATRRKTFELNCSGAGVTCTQTAGRMTLTVSGGGGGAPTGATYLTQTPDGTLGAEQAMSLLGTGLVKNTTGTGAQSIAVSGTDYAPATSGSSVLLGNGAGGFSSYAGATCGANQFATQTSSAGALTCSAVNDATGAVKGGVVLTGDLGGTASSPSVVDDSHNHTSSTISALDVADITTGTLSQARGGTGAGALTCTAGDFITSNGTAYSCSTPPGGGGGLSHAQVQRLVAIGGP
jgi:hypothetical protein